jgi:hypothetical protein
MLDGDGRRFAFCTGAPFVIPETPQGVVGDRFRRWRLLRSRISAEALSGTTTHRDRAGHKNLNRL